MSRLTSRFHYLYRVFQSYLLAENSQLTFWHETPAVNEKASFSELGPYFMTFEQKARYPGPFDNNGVPLLDYHGKVGRQYNPIAVAQYALGCYNLFKAESQGDYYTHFLRNADWLTDNLRITPAGTRMWAHDFDFEYFRPLKAPWFSGLAQGQGLSVLVRAFDETGDPRYWEAAEAVFATLKLPISEGGVVYKDQEGALWIEEYLVNPPTHILNGFFWALWGIYDYWVFCRKPEALDLFRSFTNTLVSNLHKYDAGFWSYYELTPQRIKSPASPFYHKLHLVQLDIMSCMTKEAVFAEYSEKWRRYSNSLFCRNLALACKGLFKLIYY